MRKIIYILFAFLALQLMHKSVIAQDGNTIYFINNIPQSNYSNPASLPNCKFYIGVPAMSSFGFNLENGSFSYNDIFSRRTDDSLIIDKNKLLGALSDDNKLSYDISEQIFTLGMRMRRSYFTLSASSKFSTNFNYTKDLMTFLLKGNEPFIGKTANLSDSKLGLNAYTEIAFGFSREIGKKLTLGLRFKYLIGIVNVYTERSDLQFTTDANTYALTTSSDFLIHSSSPFDSLQGMDKQIKNIKPKNLMDNTGYAFDFGGEYRLNKRWTIGVSVVDLGSINWKSNVKDYVSKNPNKQFNFNGFDINKAFQGGSINDSIFTAMIDTLKETLGIKETNGTSYNAPLKTKLYTSIAFSLTRNDRFGILMRNDFANKSVNTLISVSYNRNIGRWFAITLSNTFVAGNIFNPGAGFNLNLGPIQFYMIGDHFSSLYAADMKNLGIHFGMNFIFGKTKQGYRYEKEKTEVFEEEKSSRYKKLLPITPVITDSSLLKDSNFIKLPDTSKIQTDTAKLIPVLDTSVIIVPPVDTAITPPIVIPPADTTTKPVIPVETISIPDDPYKNTLPVLPVLKKPDTKGKPVKATKPVKQTATPAKTTTTKPTTVKPKK
ncbi:MAG: DUF5723 family protein [Bacteroidales bacterium]